MADARAAAQADGPVACVPYAVPAAHHHQGWSQGNLGQSFWVELFESENDWYGNPDTPTIFAWKALTRGASVPVQELERNPYYWKIDIAGNRLPYIDRINRPNLGDREAILLDVIAGANDYMNPYTLGYLTNYPVLKQNEATGGYRVLPQFGWSDVLGVVTFNMSIDDEVLRDLFRNKDFRVALSIGYDRNEINEVVFNGLYKRRRWPPGRLRLQRRRPGIQAAHRARPRSCQRDSGQPGIDLA